MGLFGLVLALVPAAAGADSWLPMTTTNAPSPRVRHTAIWTGSKMIVWGGNPFTQTGGLYDPTTDSWTPMSTDRAPFARYGDFTAVWTGSKLIVWGGAVVPSPGGIMDGQYDPATDTWSPVSAPSAPLRRFWPASVWTGSRMIVWNGSANTGPLQPVTGGRYDPETDTWAPLSTIDAPPPDDRLPALIWTGSRMLHWLGYLTRGYDPASDTWEALAQWGGPYPGYLSAVRMGSKMVVWGGYDGGVFDATSGTWTPMTTLGAPVPRTLSSAVWAGTKMILWGGANQAGWRNDGGLYLPGGPPGPLVAGVERVFPLVPQCSIPDGVQALSVNLAVTQATATGNVRVYPAGMQPPPVPALTYSEGDTRSNNAIVRLNVSGELAVRLAPAGTAHFILDVTGYFDSAGSFFTLAPCRAVDTRFP